MRRADRLFSIVQLLRSRRAATTATWLAEKLEVSERTIYRDVRDLIASGVPITGEAGVGYMLPRGFDLPPLMFSRDELAAIVLGVRVVRAWGDPTLGRAAQGALDRICAVLPDPLRDAPERTVLFAPTFHITEAQRRGLASLREAIASRQKVRLCYTRRDGESSERVVRPLGLFFWGHAWSVAAYCELRAAFRHFRLDRVAVLERLDVRFEDEPGITLEDYLRRMAAETD